MQKPVLIYCYDAWCGWCYGFSNVMLKTYEQYVRQLDFEVISGGMILPANPVHIGATATYIASAYKRVEALTHIKFGDDYLWHINNPAESDWYPNSEKAAIALAIIKDLKPLMALAFAHDLLYALHYEGRDLTDDEAYRHLLPKYNLKDNDFYDKLHSSSFKEKAHYDFALAKQLQVTTYPAVLLQTAELKFHLIARGYTDFDVLNSNINAVLKAENKI